MSGEIPFSTSPFHNSEIPLPPNPTPVNPGVLPNILRGLLDAAAQEAASSINCTMIGTIISFDSGTQTARISINFQKVLDKVPAGKPQIFNYPTLIQCPVVSLFGGVSFMTFPIKAGDTCLVFFNDRDIDSWITTGTTTTPNSKRVHSLSDGIALVGIRPISGALADYDDDNVKIGYSDITSLKVGEEEAVLETGALGLTRVGVDALTEKVILEANALTLKTALDSLFTALLSWVDTDGDTPNPATILLITAAKTQVDAILK